MTSTPIYIKMLRDFVVFAAIGVWVASLLLGSSVSRVAFYGFFFSVVVVVALMVSALRGDGGLPVRALALIRWMLPVFLPFAFWDQIPPKGKALIATAVLLLFYLHIALQLVQLFTISNWLLNRFGLSARNPGILFLPNTAAAFSIACYIIIRHWGRRYRIGVIRLLRLLLILSVALTASGTGLVVAVLVLIVEHRRVRNQLPLAVIGTLLAGFMFFAFTSFRGVDYLLISGGNRLALITDHWSKVGFWGTRPGVATNTFVLLQGRLGLTGGVIADSTIGSVMINLGWVGTVWLAIGYVGLVFFAHRNREHLELLQVIMILILFSFTTIVSEAYALFFPVSLVLASEAPKALRKRRRNTC